MVDAVYTRVLLAVVAALTAALLYATPAQAQDMTQELEEYNAVCFDEQGEWLKTDGCIESAERIGIEVDIIESMDKGCVLSDLFEDYSCKGPSAPSSSSSFANEQGSSEASDQGCFSVDMTNPEVSGEDIDILTQQFGFDAAADNDDNLYSPECFTSGQVPYSHESMANNRCYDVLGDARGNEWVEFIGCPSGEASEQAYTPITQRGTYAPANWRDHVTPVKLARTSTTFTLSTTSP